MKKNTTSKEEIIRKIVDIDCELLKNREEHHLTPEAACSLRMKRERLEKILYK